VVWFKVDDKLHDHRKARKAGKAAMGVWVLAGSWSMSNLTDGFIPEDVLGRWGSRADAKRLVDAGLWDDAVHEGEKGWRFHDWSRFQPSAAVTEAIRIKEAEAGARGNHKRWHVARGVTDPDCELCHRVPDQVPDGVPMGSPESPPNRPVPVPEPNTEPDGSGAPAESTSQVLVAEWIDHCNARPPGRVIGQIGREVKALLAEGIPANDVRAGLAAWHRKGLHPSTLASVVHEVRQASPSVRVDNSGRLILPPLPKGVFEQ
jgi:hypothetical protein